MYGYRVNYNYMLFIVCLYTVHISTYLTLAAKMMAGIPHNSAHQQQHTAKTVTMIANIIGPGLPTVGSL